MVRFIISIALLHLSTRTGAGNPTPQTTKHALPTRARHRLVTQQAINALTIQEKVEIRASFIPIALQKHHIQQIAQNLEHYENPMVHPTTGETIPSYKRLVKDPETAEVWQTAFGKEFGGMAQGKNKTGQKGRNTIFVMNHHNITKVLKAGKKFTYANPVVDHRPQKEDPNRIRIIAGGNLIESNGKLLVPTANSDTAKLHWNSVVSTALTKYMCIDTNSFYLSASLEYYKYMKIPYALFPHGSSNNKN